METIEDITAEMRNRSVTVIGGRTITMRNFVSQEQCEEWADRIEKAVTNCNHLKMREALEDSTELLRNLGVLLGDDITSKQIYANDVALSAQPRNCDVYRTSWDVVTHWDGGLDSTQSLVLMLDWLLAEAKGETNENTL